VFSELRAQALGSTKGGQGFPPLENVGREIRLIVKEGSDGEGLLDGHRWLDQDFDRLGLRLALNSRSPIVHLATHFALGPDQSSSRLLLGDGSAMSLSELQAGLRSKLYNVTRVQLLVLSACQTGLGNGQELESLAAILEKQSVRSIIATLWPVKDVSTSQLMYRFYDYLKSGVPRGEALRRSQLDLLKGVSVLHSNETASRRNQYFSRPLYWAPFILMGQWKWRSAGWRGR